MFPNCVGVTNLSNSTQVAKQEVSTFVDVLQNHIAEILREAQLLINQESRDNGTPVKRVVSIQNESIELRRSLQ